MARKVLTALKIREVSGVDRPAQEGATVTILKRAEGGDPESAEKACKPKSKDGGGEISDVCDCGKPECPECQKNTKKSASVGGDSQKEKHMDELQKVAAELKAAQAELAKAKAELAIAQAVGALKGAERVHYDSLATDVARAEFLKLDGEGRSTILKAALESNPVVFTSVDGEVYRKNDDARLVRMAKQADEDRKLAKAEREARVTAELSKRASDELGNLPGEELAKVALLRAVDGIPAEARAEVAKLLLAANSGLAKAFSRQGVGTQGKGGAVDPNVKLAELAKSHAATHKVSEGEALRAILLTNEGAELYAATRGGV